MPLLTQAEIERTELETVLASRIIARSPNLVKMLRYIGMKYLEGQEDAIKEYSIGVEALGRPPDFDPKEDSVVRVEAHRLREKLKQYYEIEGTDHPLVISLQVGHYILQFHHRSEGDNAPADALPASDPSGSPGSAGVRGSPSSEQRPEIAWPANYVAVKEPDEAEARPRIRVRVGERRRQFGLVLLVVAAGIGIFATLRVVRRREGNQPAVAAPLQLVKASGLAAAAAPAGSVVRMIAGYPKKDDVDSSGEVWGPDRYYSGGQAIVEPHVFIARAPDLTLFKSAREGEFSYNIPLKPGTYELLLYFVETEYGPGTPRGGGENSRLFSINLNGKPLLTEFDIYSDADGTDIADERVFKDVSPAADGELHLSFITGTDHPILNALQIFPSPAGKIQPIRIVAQKHSFTDAAGHLWKPDRYFRGGRLSTSINKVLGTRDPGLYAVERFGNVSYAIPVAEGRYAVTLYFAETYFGPDNLGGGGEGKRLFDLDCNGVALLRDFDVFKEAGGDNRAVVRTFHDLRPNAQGKLLLSFVPVKNYASVRAIRVIDESR
jgi:Malectin domain